MRIPTLAISALLLASLGTAQVVITDVRETTATPTPGTTPRLRATPRATPAEEGGISIVPATETTSSAIRATDPIVITPAPGSTGRRARRAVPATPPPTTVLPDTPAPPPSPTPAPESSADPAAPPSTSQASDATTASAAFLPAPIQEAATPVTVREGQTISLRPEQLRAKPLDLTVPDVNETTLSNGIRLYHYESRELPRISFALLIDAGKQLDPADKVGLADLTARTLRAGGAGSLNGDQLDRALEQIGSDLEISADREYVTGSMFALKENAPKALGILADVLTKPLFEKDKLEQQRGRMLEGLRRENDEPSEIARREFRKLLYGRNNPLARTPTSSSLQALTREEVVGFYEERYRPSTLRIGVAGDISLDDARRIVEEAFASWSKPEAPPAPRPMVDEASGSTPGVYLIRKQTAQSQIRLGHLGMARHAPEQYAVAVLNNVYGTGGFSSRLMNVVRTKHGYAYGTGGAIQSDTPIGLFFAAAGSKTKTTAAAIKAILEVTQDLLRSAIAPEEIETAKRDVIFSFFTELDTPGEIVWTAMRYDFLGYPEDFLKTYPEKIRQVSEQEMIAAARKFISPERIKILVVGNESDFDAPLSQFGNVQEIPLEQNAGPANGAGAVGPVAAR